MLNHLRPVTLACSSLLLLSQLCVPATAAGPSFELPSCPALSSEKPATVPSDSQSLPAIRLQPASTGRKPSGALEQARKVNLMPAAVIPSSNEADAARKAQLDAEQQQLTELWAATIDRNPDIQYVITMVQPSSDDKHTRSMALKLLGGALFSVSQAATSFTPSIGSKAGLNIAGRAIDSVFSGAGGKGKSPELTKEACTTLYTVVRQTAEHLVEQYRLYRLAITQADEAQQDLAYLQQIAPSAARSDGGTNFFFEYTVRKALREAKASVANAEMHRQALIDLAGIDAVDHLDSQISDEREALARLIGAPDFNPKLMPTPPKPAMK